MMDNEKDSYRHTWTYDLECTSSGERSAFCEKSALTRARLARPWGGGRGEGLPSPR
jgi:hypothetical protein